MAHALYMREIGWSGVERARTSLSFKSSNPSISYTSIFLSSRVVIRRIFCLGHQIEGTVHSHALQFYLFIFFKDQCDKFCSVSHRHEFNTSFYDLKAPGLGKSMVIYHYLLSNEGNKDDIYIYT